MRNDFSRTDHLIDNIRIDETSRASTDWSGKTSENRVVREKALDTPGALFRVLNSVRGDLWLSGRCCRAYMISALLNLQVGRIIVALGRPCNLVPLVGLNMFRRNFCEGFFTRSHWYAVGKPMQEQHFKTHFPSYGAEYG